MSKSIQDYREIVKVLKLQLLKVREQNNSLSKTLGIANQNQTSSFTPRLEKLAKNTKQFAKHWFLFSLFAHKCQLIGVTPEMVFRIADKKRDKKVGVSDLTQIMKRLKLKLDDVQISRLLSSITKSGNVMYEQYLQYINAFQINSQSYPPKNQRTYSQICLFKFGQSLKQNKVQIQNIFKDISRQTKSYINFDQFASYCQKNTKLKDVQIICIFVTLDPSSQCLIEKDIFIREMNKINALIQKGVSYQDDKYTQTQQRQTIPGRKGNNNKIEDFDVQQETGVQAGQKKKQPKKENKLLKGDLNNLVQELKKQGISVSNLILNLLQKQQTRKLIRPFSLIQFGKIIQQINKKLDKKKIIKFFKCLDSSSNGSASTDQLIKLWLQGKQLADSSQNLFKLFGRHFKQIQVQQYITKFSTLGYNKDDIIDLNMLSNVFSGMNLSQSYLKLVVDNHLPSKCNVSKFIELLQTGGAQSPSKAFQPMKKIDYENMCVAVKKLVSKQDKRFPKLSRQSNTDKDSGQKNYWQTIFTDEWACWNYCLQTAYKLTGYWRDPQFGPSKGDPHGFRSIVGNQSEVPPGLPYEDQITWMSFEQMLEKQGKKLEQIKLFSDNLVANDIMQGRVGDCWFVSSLSIITSDDQFVKGKSLAECKVRPQASLSYGIHPIIFHSFRKYGLYVFKFFKGFKPVYVVVDQLFPIQISTNQLIFAKSPTPGLQWVAFLEKAYAKLHHCYSNMISGDISQGISDLTNTLPIKQVIVNTKPEQLLQKIIKLSTQKQLMGCSINAPSGAGVQQPVTLDDERTGLFYGHAYSIGDFIDLKPITKQDYKLMRVRNPWGHGQWMLDWSDKPSDPEYSKLQKYQKAVDQFYVAKINQAKSMRQNYNQITQYKPGEDGQFLIKFEDFAKIYSNLFTGYNLKGKDYKCYTIKGKWNKQTPSGLCKAKGATQAQAKNFVKDNYQFILQVKQKTDILMFLIQQDGRLFRGEKYPYKQVCNGIIILSFNLQPGQKMLPKFDTSKMTLPNLKLELKRQTNYWHKFEAGKYAILPCKMQNKIPQTQFQFRLYSQKQVSIKKVNGSGDQDFKILSQNSAKGSSQLQTMLDFIAKNTDGKKK